MRNAEYLGLAVLLLTSAKEIDGIPMKPGRCRMESFAHDDDLTDSDGYCLTKAAFDPVGTLKKEIFDNCEAGPPQIDGRHGIFNLACANGPLPSV